MTEPFRSLPLNALRVFGVAARHRSFTAAAQELRVTQVAVSRQIAALESHLGVALFDRGARSARLTDAGRYLAADIAPALDMLDRATDQLMTQERRRVVRLRLYPTFAQHWLLPRLAAFCAAHPDIDLRLDTTVAAPDFRGTDIDLAVQLGHGNWRDARSLRLFGETIDAVCAPAVARGLAGTTGAPVLRPVLGPVLGPWCGPAIEASLAGAVLLHARYRRREWQTWCDAVGATADLRGGMVFDTSLLTYGAARQGLGLALAQIDLLAEDLAAGTLVRPFGRAVATGAAFHVVWPEFRRLSGKARVVIDWLADCAAADAPAREKRAVATAATGWPTVPPQTHPPAKSARPQQRTGKAGPLRHKEKDAAAIQGGGKVWLGQRNN
jgi:LysR family glycine cleavage system transcriptional activator